VSAGAEKRSGNGLPLGGVSADALVAALWSYGTDALAVSDRESGRFVVVSDSYCALTGYAREELVGRTSLELGLIADASTRSDVLGRADRGMGETYELRMRRKDGEVRLFEFSMLVLSGGSMLTISRDVTERRRIEAQLKASEGRFRVAVESLLEAFKIISAVRDKSGEIVDFRYEYVNAAYCSRLGLDREQILARRGSEISAEFLGSERFAIFRRVAITGEPCTAEVSMPAAAQPGAPLVDRVSEISVVPLEQNLVVSARDVSERREADAELALRGELLELAHDAVIVRDPVESRITFWNREAQAVYGFSSAEAAGQVIYELLATEFPESQQAVTDALARVGRWRGRLRHTRKDGTVIVVSSRQALRRDADGRPTAIIELNSDISERDLAQEALRESEERFRLLAENSRDVIRLFDVDARIRYASPSCATVLGYEPQELLGRHSTEFQHPADVTGHHARRQVVAAGGGGEVTVTYRSRRKDGGYVWLESSVRALRDEKGEIVGFQEAAREITERKRAEETLRESEERFRLLAENSTDVITRVSPDSMLRYVSPSSRELYGYDPEEMVGRSAREYVHPEDLPALLRAGERVRFPGARDHAVEYRVRRKDGSYVWVESKTRTLWDRESGEPAELQGATRDISERKHAEAEIRRAKEEAEGANRAKSDFLSRMSHELRTPLHAILGFGELLERDELRTGQHEKLAEMTRGASHLLTLVDEALDLAAVEKGDLKLSLEPVHVGELFQETLAMVAPLAAAQSLTFAVPTATESDVHVMADRLRLKQALLNLLSNAVKYNRKRGRIRLICASESDSSLRITVADDGIGIAPANMPRVFEPFDRLGAEATEVEGTGLGLALTKRLIEAMAGEIGVESTLREGTTFWIKLPIVEAPKSRPMPARPGAPAPSVRVPGPARTVLYIEDNPSNIRLVETILAERPEVTLLVASQGSLGLELAREHRPSLILLDLNLPDISGEDVLRRIRSDPRTAAIPVAMLSADATSRQVERLTHAGADHYLTKPFAFDQFMAVIDSSTPHTP
jgi:PAS domain S-box-containing protein